MSNKNIAYFISTVVVSIFALGIWIDGGQVKWAWLRFFSVSVWVSVIGLLLWEKWIWRLSFVQGFDKVPRDLRGTWKGTLDSFWEDPETGESPVKTVFLVIHQDATEIHTMLLTDESRSVSTMASITDDQSVASLDYMYLNRPDPSVEHRSRMHHGSTSLDIIGRPATRLRGRYWTDRDTRGELEFTERCSHQVDGYEEAVELFS